MQRCFKLVLLMSLGLASTACSQVPPAQPSATPEPQTSASPVSLAATSEPDPPTTAVQQPGYSEVGNLYLSESSFESNQRGRAFFVRACAQCHGDQGQGLGRRVPDIRYTRNYRYGSGKRAVYRTTVFGIPGSGMGSFRNRLPGSLAEDLAGYTRSLQLGQLPPEQLQQRAGESTGGNGRSE